MWGTSAWARTSVCTHLEGWAVREGFEPGLVVWELADQSSLASCLLLGSLVGASDH